MEARIKELFERENDMTSWKAQIGKGKYCLQFETNDYKKYKAMEKVAQEMVDKADKERTKERASQMRTLGHL